MRTLDFDIERITYLRTVEQLSYSAIGRIIGKDHTTVMYHCKQRNIPAPETIKVLHRTGTGKHMIRTIKVVRVVHTVRPPHKYAHLLEENLLPARSYKSYLKEALERPTEKRYYKTYYQTPLTPDEARRLRTHGNIIT